VEDRRRERDPLSRRSSRGRGLESRRTTDINTIIDGSKLIASPRKSCKLKHEYRIHVLPVEG
jgi:hypothetical protein